MEEGTAEYVTKMWRIGLRTLIDNHTITFDEFASCFAKEFLGKEPLTDRETEIVIAVNSVMGDTDRFARLVKEEIDWITRGTLPDAKEPFYSVWLSALMECQEGGHIDGEDMLSLKDSVDFERDGWGEDEKSAINTVLDMLRMTLILKNKNAFEFMENPSFELLMFVNGLEV